MQPELMQLKAVRPEQRGPQFKAIRAAADLDAYDFGTAENVILLSYLQQRAFQDLGEITLQMIKYPPMPGPLGDFYPTGSDDVSHAFRQSLAAFFQDRWGVSVPYDNIFASSGVVAALEQIALALFEPDDRLLAPAPLWYGFPWSFSQTAGMQFTTFQITDGTDLTVDDVQQALHQYPDAKLLVLTNPNNPLGTNYTRDQLEPIYETWLKDSDRQIVSDEIYACSQVGNPENFVSALSLDAYQSFGDRIQVTWGFSKDFGLAGFRIGFVITKSQQVSDAFLGAGAASTSWFSPFVNTNLYATKKLFLDANEAADPSLANAAMDEYHGLLQTQYHAAAGALKTGGIPYYQGNQGAIFFWIDLSAYLDKVPPALVEGARERGKQYQYDDPREEALEDYLKDEGVHLIRGQECFNAEPGYFRLCYTAEPLERVGPGIGAMVAALNALG